MSDDRDPRSPGRRASEGAQSRPDYAVYGRGSGRSMRPPDRPASRPRDQDGERPYHVYRSGPRLLSRLRRDPRDGVGPARGPRPDKDRPGTLPRRRITVKRVVLGLIALLVAWLVLSLVLFLISAQIQSGHVSKATKAALSSSGYPLWSANTVLVLGSDVRPKHGPSSKEPGAQTSGSGRSDTILLLRVGGGHSAKLSIPRDTVVNIPGHGTDKINAAFAEGGAPLAIRTVEQYLGIKVNHVVLVNFTNFPKFIDALGGVDFISHKRLLSLISGGRKNGGFTLRLRRGSNHLDGQQALQLARTRENALDPSENDLTRERRQQQLLADIKGKITSPSTFFRLPWVAWTAPQAIKTDMGGLSLLGLFASIETTGSPKPRLIAAPSQIRPVSINGASGLEVPDSVKRRSVHWFLTH